MKVSAIIPAAGQGTRMGSAIPKQYLLLKGRPILHYTLQAFARCGNIDSVTLVVPQSDIDAVKKEWLEKFRIVKRVVAGGEKRQDSVYNGFKALAPDTDTVIVHDGVRPFIDAAIIQKTIAAAQTYGAAITAIPVNDTIKEVGDAGFVTRTVDRSGLWRVQTPQAFQYELLAEAFAKAAADCFYGTDEGSLLEHAGKKVKIVEGSELNIKITRREDLFLGESILNDASLGFDG